MTDIHLAFNAAVAVTLEEGTANPKWRYYAFGQGDGVALNLVVSFKRPAAVASPRRLQNADFSGT